MGKRSKNAKNRDSKKQQIKNDTNQNKYTYYAGAIVALVAVGGASTFGLLFANGFTHGNKAREKDIPIIPVTKFPQDIPASDAIRF